MGIGDIAKALGVSETTVSRAISGTGRISPETRNRVLEYVKKMGYIPNASASSLATTRTHNIAYAMPLDEPTIRLSFFLECMFGVNSVVQEQGYNLIMVDSSVQELTRFAASHRVDGIILSAFDDTDEALAGLLRYNIPLLLVGNTKVDGVIQVQYEFRPAFRELTQRLYRAWQCPMALMVSAQSNRANLSRRECFCAALRELGVEEPVVCSSTLERSDVLRTLKRLRAQGIRGLVCGDEAVCGSILYSMLAERPEGEDELADLLRPMRLASFFSDNTIRDFFPGIPTLEGDSIRLGQEAANIFLKQINEGNAPAITSLEPKIIMDF